MKEKIEKFEQKLMVVLQIWQKMQKNILKELKKEIYTKILLNIGMNGEKTERRMPMSNVIAIANQKGGVGKTTTTFWYYKSVVISYNNVIDYCTYFYYD